MVAKREQLSAAQRLLQIVRPILHHFGTRLQIEGMIVGRTHGIARRVGELQFDVFMPIASLMKYS